MPKSARPPKARPGATATSSTLPRWLLPALVLGTVVVVLVLVIVTQQSKSGKSTPSSRVEVADVVEVSGTPLPPDRNATPDPAVGMMAPTLRGVSFDGAAVSAPPSGPNVMVFLAHWCPHCQREVPVITKLRSSGAWPSSVGLTGVSTSVTPERGNYPPSAWLSSARWDAPVLVDTAKGAAASAYGQAAFPFMVWIDASGKVVLRTSGEIPEATLLRMVNELGAGKTPTPAAQ